MAEVTNEFIFETLRAIQRDIADVRSRMERLKNEMRAMKTHLVALVQNDLQRDTDIAALTARVARIERRLELTNGGEG